MISLTKVDRSERRLRILHTSDFHLDSPGDKACKSLEKVVNFAIENDVDLVINAGDLFDHNRVGDDLVRFVVGQLRRLAVPTVILPGNHDCLVPGSAFERTELWKDCANVRIIRAGDGETLDLPEPGVSVWGKSINSYDDVRPLAGIPQPQKNGYWHVAVAHGYYIGAGAALFPSYHITEEEIAGSGWDYIALGHIITFGCVCSEPVACYSGSPSLTGAAALVELTEETGVQVTRCSF